jgi:hypothetical protein
MNCTGYGRKWSQLNLRYYEVLSQHLPGGAKKTKENIRISISMPTFAPETSKYKTGMLTT